MRTVFIAASIALMTAPASTAQVRVASLGKCNLELGGAIEDCRVAYRTFGQLAADRRNAVLIPTWFASRSEAWVPLLGPKGAVDTTGFFIVVVESLGAGESSSAANSAKQSGLQFPEVTIGDMVDASYRVARDHLQLPELHAVVGISLGAQQAFEWGVRYPEYVRRIVPIVGGPRQAVYGRAFWELVATATNNAIRQTTSSDSTAYTLARLMIVGVTSPASANRRPAEKYADYLTEQARQLRSVNLFEWSTHAGAILRHDIARRFGGDLARAAESWRARTLVVTATFDHSIDPQPAQEFARLIKADTLVLTSPSGHTAFFSDSIAKARVREFVRR
jgi:homoserine O-acetyltransferase